MPFDDATPQGAAPAAPQGEPQTVPAASPQGTPSDQAAPQTESTPAPQSFTFAGRQFQSQAEAENYFQHTLRSTNGRVRTMQEQIAKLQAPPPAPTTPATEAPLYDKDVYAELVKTYGKETAESYRLEETNKSLLAKQEKSFSERLQPIEQATQRAEVEARTIELFSRAKQVTNPADGRVLFPEFSHDEASKAIVQIWEAEIPPEVAVTPKGIRLAVEIYRGRVATGMARSTQPPPSRPAPSGQSVSTSVGGQGFAPGSAPSANPITAVPRSYKSDPVTGERYI